MQTRDFLNSQNGFVTGIGAYAALLVMGVIGLAAIYSSIVAEKSKKDELGRAQSFYIAQAGAEYAMKKMYSDLDPTVPEPGKELANGSFVISFSSPTATIQGRFGISTSNITIDKPNMADCTAIDTTNTTLQSSNRSIANIQLSKTCLTSITVDKIKFSWVTVSAATINPVTIDGSSHYNGVPSSTSGTQIELVNRTISDASSHEIQVTFSSSMSGKTVTMIITFSDGSTGTSVFAPT